MGRKESSKAKVQTKPEKPRWKGQSNSSADTTFDGPTFDPCIPYGPQAARGVILETRVRSKLWTQAEWPRNQKQPWGSINSEKVIHREIQPYNWRIFSYSKTEI